MNIHYFQHVAYEGLGSLETWAAKPGTKITATRLYEDHRFPFIDLFDVLIILGGPMGANDENKFSWMTQEKKMIEKAIQKNKTVVGICLGAQLIADVLGAKVYKNPEKEIGWFPISLTEKGKEIFRISPAELDVFHWHGDTFDLPANAVHLAKSDACHNQAYLFKDNVIGLQFHLEVNKQLLNAFVENGSSELVKSKFVQSKESILNKNITTLQQNNLLLEQVLQMLLIKPAN